MIAVVAAQGELLAFPRTDGCKLPSTTIAINKAFATARKRGPNRRDCRESRNVPQPVKNFDNLR